MKAVNINTGIGTLTRAFRTRGGKIVWAQEASDIAAQIYQYNFPDIPFYKGKIQETDISKIPEFDLLLASLRAPRSSIVQSRQPTMNKFTEIQKQETEYLENIIIYHKPKAVCFTLPVNCSIMNREIIEMLRRQRYFYSYKVMDGEQFGGVPFKGRKIYVVGFTDNFKFNMFRFPSSTSKLLGISQLLDRSLKKEDVYYRLPEKYAKLLSSIALKDDEIYQVVHHYTQDHNKQLSLKIHSSCPILTNRSSREFFVKDVWGARRLSATEYLQLQGLDPELFTKGISQKDIWSITSYIGTYQVELKLADQILRVLKDSVGKSEKENIQKQIADYLIREFDPYLDKKQIGLLCMPSGTGKSNVLKCSILELLKMNMGKCKIVILAGFHEQCRQIEHLLRNSGVSVLFAQSSHEINEFMLNELQLLISSYMRWEDFINQYQPVGLHTRLLIFGMDTETGWRYLRNTKEYLPQCTYMGITSMPDNRAIEIFGPVLYQYTMSRAISDGLLLPVYVEQLLPNIEMTSVSQSGGADNTLPLYTEMFASMISKAILADLNMHRGKAIIIASSIDQAQELKKQIDLAKSERISLVADESQNAYLYISQLTLADRERNLREFTNSMQGILIVVDMWTGLSVPEITNSYVLAMKPLSALIGVIGLVSRPCREKQYGRIIVLDAEVQDNIHFLLDTKGEGEQFFRFCDCVRTELYEEAGVILRSMKQTDKSLAFQIEKELNFLFTGQPETESINENQLRFMARLWLFTSKTSKSWLNFQNLRTEDVSGVGEKNSEEDEKKQQLEKASAKQAVVDSRAGEFRNSAEKGSMLENTLLRLLRHLFIWNQEDNPDLDRKTTEIMSFLRKVSAGTQNGRDIELIYIDDTGQKRRCYFECKYIHSKKLKEESILAKILQTQREAKEEIEHWILFAPNAKLDNYSVALFEDAERNPGKYYPIKDIQVWNEDNQIDSLLGIEPEIYNIFFKTPVQAEALPEECWTAKKQQIIQTWKQKIAPVILLPRSMRLYPFQPHNLIFDLQNNLQERKRYEDLYQDYAQLYYYDENEALSQECLEEYMYNWLYFDIGDIKVITGEYGDGKTFFLYCLCRSLLKEFIKNPQKNYLPIFISLKNLKTDKSPAALLEKRMRQLGCNYSDFQMLKENFHVLICLDGFDEISSTIDCGTIQQNAKLLAECCEYFCGTKIIVTSRNQCFYESKVNEWLYKRLGGFEVLRIAPVKLIDREKFIFSKLEENDRFAKWEQLNATGKIQELMGKPFFLDMTRQLLESGEKLGEDSIVSIYEHYIRKCLSRKFYLNFERENSELPDENQIVDRIYNALQYLAYVLHKQGKEELLKDELEEYLGKPLTEVLWLERNADTIDKEDANNRFSMRTLLKYGEDGKVTFSHRSFQEYFVAVYLVATMDKHLDRLRILLTENCYNYEILFFFAEQIKSEPDIMNDRIADLIALANIDSESEGCNYNMSLAAKVMQILYYVNKTIPIAEWKGKNLSGINIPGANLSKQNFIGTKFLKANLNNVILDGCDCSYCDMSGARLGETNKIIALKFDGQVLLSLYKDGSLRQWDINSLEEISCVIGCADFRDTVFGSGTDLYVQDNYVLELLGKQKNEIITYMRYLKNKDYSILSVYEGRILISESKISGECILLVNTYDFMIEHQWYVKKNSKGILVKNQFVIIYDGDVSIELYSINRQQSEGTIDIRKSGEINSLAVHDNNGNIFVALGHETGGIFIYQCGINKSELVAKGRGSERGLSHLAFCGASLLAAANTCGEICLLHISYNKGTISMDRSKVLKLGIYCKGIKTEGLVPEEIRLRLERKA